MKKIAIVFALMLLGMPVAGHAQMQVRQATLIEEGDARLPVIRPFAEALLKSGADAALAVLKEKQPSFTANAAVKEQLAAVVATFGSDRYTVAELRNGRNSDVIVRVRPKADGADSGFIILLDEAGAVTGVSHLRRPGS